MGTFSMSYNDLELAKFEMLVQIIASQHAMREMMRDVWCKSTGKSEDEFNEKFSADYAFKDQQLRDYIYAEFAHLDVEKLKK